MPQEVQDCNVVKEKPTTGIKGALDQVLHFWPLIFFTTGVILAVVSALGQTYVKDIATDVYLHERVMDPVSYTELVKDLVKINTRLEDQNKESVEIRRQLTTIEDRLDTVIRIQLEGP